MPVSSRDNCQLRAASKLVSQQLRHVQCSVMDKVNSVRLKMTQQRSELAELRRCLTDTERRVTRLGDSLKTLSDSVAQLDSQFTTESYVDTVIDKLLHYGRAIRLVACHVDTDAAGLSSQPASDHGRHSVCPHRSG